MSAIDNPVEMSMSQSIAYQDEIPVRLEHLPGCPSVSRQMLINERNENNFRLITSLEEFRSDSASETDDDNHEQIQRLETKVNLLLQMVTSLVSNQSAIPDPVAVNFSSNCISWNDSVQLKNEGWFEVSIFVSDKIPQPITFIAEVEHAPKSDQLFNICAHFRFLSETAQNELDKFIFRHHRRQIAFSKQV